MTITFVHSGKAFLPEIAAYTALFEPLGISCKHALPGEVDKISTDVEWYFMGTDFQKTKKGRIKIHEYASSSVGSFRELRNLSKRWLNQRPDFRIYLNTYVEESFGFTDEIPFGFRDMGVDAKWIHAAPRLTDGFEYDFVYLGDLSAARKPRDLLNIFASGSMREKTLLLISSNYEELQRIYRSSPNIIFKGPITHALVPSLLQQARFGINYIIDKAPYNAQTSTKFLEYAACGLPVITTDYDWIREFQSKYGGNYFFLNREMSNFNWEETNGFNYSTPDLSDWSWEKQIRGSGVLEFLGVA